MVDWYYIFSILPLGVYPLPKTIYNWYYIFSILPLGVYPLPKTIYNVVEK